MIRINDTDYRLVLLDTNALSEFTGHTDSFRRFFTWSSDQPSFVPCFSPFSLLELRRRTDVYQRFKKMFSVFPCILLKSHEQLLEEEVLAYPDPSSINPVLLAFSMLGGEGMDLDRVLNAGSADEAFQNKEKYWNDGAPDIVEGIASLVSNYPPEGDSYSRAELEHFIWVTSFSQLAMRQPNFAKEMVDSEQAVDLNAFPSVRATSYTVWYKFYADLNRKSESSDAFDIIISSAVPYVDAIITESHLAESLRKTKRIDGFIEDLTILTLRDFRPSEPSKNADVDEVT